MTNKKTRILKQQKIAVGGVLLVIVGILVYLFSILATEVPLGEYDEGKHYSLIENPRKVRGDKIEIMEFFSYGCVHCFNLDPNLEKWIDDHKHKVRLVRMPALGNTQWREFGRAYFTLETLGTLDQSHAELFGQIHNNGKQPKTAEEFADLLTIDAEGRKRFIETYQSSNTTKLLERADRLARQFKVATVPNIVVNGKYLIRANRDVGLSRMLEIMGFLLEMETQVENQR